MSGAYALVADKVQGEAGVEVIRGVGATTVSSTDEVSLPVYHGVQHPIGPTEASKAVQESPAVGAPGEWVFAGGSAGQGVLWYTWARPGAARLDVCSACIAGFEWYKVPWRAGRNGG